MVSSNGLSHGGTQSRVNLPTVRKDPAYSGSAPSLQVCLHADTSPEVCLVGGECLRP